MLHNTRKENLGILFKSISWFVIVSSILLIIAGGIRGIVHRVIQREQFKKEQGMIKDGEHGFGHGRWMMNGGGGMMGFHHRMMFGDNGGCEMGMDGKCNNKMPCEMKKDSGAVNKMK